MVLPEWPPERSRSSRDHGHEPELGLMGSRRVESRSRRTKSLVHKDNGPRFTPKRPKSTREVERDRHGRRRGTLDTNATRPLLSLSSPARREGLGAISSILPVDPSKTNPLAGDQAAITSRDRGKLHHFLPSIARLQSTHVDRAVHRSRPMDASSTESTARAEKIPRDCSFRHSRLVVDREFRLGG